ncbi:MAG: DnaJ domain-containing protein [Candidatus Margulisbacteria bacterium]|nr:DnaJ domain-containing protein [Candidatus Margulisiibacteriota bacterium]MBU1021588.1 DnaJ domain-containing protein [Candidatus Margulisiibacteriota bacterium]MBU1728739.1 DnaJ domain-containing protein [Candidatus Margulisiibacteriota bacterium]MBU1955705.1 DnaJ domain-containing protein [Candidatus Margulisiibacteriota bacterium]
MQDYYKVLGVSESATQDEIKSVYRTLAKKYHPDMHQSDKSAAEEKFKKISEAYYVVGNPQRRKEYDDQRKMGAAAGARGGVDPAQGFDFEDLLSHLGFTHRRGRQHKCHSTMDYDMYDDAFSQFFGGAAGGTQGGYRVNVKPDAVSTDVMINAKIPRSLAAQGGKVDLRMAEGKTLTVKVPKGTTDGTKLRLRGWGNECPLCHKRGDLFLKVNLN